MSSLRNMLQFYPCLPIRDELRREFSWTHYQALMPTEAELQAELERDRALLEMNQP